MLQTAKARLNALKELMERDIACIHPDDCAEYAKEVRDFLSRNLAAKRRSSHDRHSSHLDAA